MNNLFLFLLVGLMTVVVLNWIQQPGPPTYTYIPVEIPRSPKTGCMPIVVIMLAALLFGLLMIGR